MQVDVKATYVLTLTQEEYELLFFGIGNTSPNSRKAAGMTEEQAEFFYTFFSQLKDPRK